MVKNWVMTRSIKKLKIKIAKGMKIKFDRKILKKDVI
jgi:hypothetical protein